MTENMRRCPVADCHFTLVDTENNVQAFCAHYNATHNSQCANLFQNNAEVRTSFAALHVQHCKQCNNFLYPVDDTQQLNDHLGKCQSCPMPDCDYESVTPWIISTILTHIRSQHSNISAPITDTVQQYLAYHDLVQCNKCYRVYA